MRLFLLLLAFLFFSCRKTKTPASIEVDNTWQCEIGGRLYKGNIDTSFYSINQDRDTIVTLTGSTLDRKGNIALRMYINRRSWRSDSLYMYYFTLDTASTNYLITIPTTYLMRFTVEQFNGGKLIGSFSGKLMSRTGSVQEATNGRISVELGKGNLTPKFMDATIGSKKLQGAIRSAVIKANTLIIDGFCFNGDSTYQLQVRTGGTIRTGTYRSVNGDVGFQSFIPSIVTHYVSDSLGDLSVTILSVDGNIVTGNIEGTALEFWRGVPVSINGRFKCAVRDYSSVPDAVNQWKFSMDNQGQPPFVTAAGNIQSASIKQNNGRYKLQISGTTDNSNSVFYVTLVSYTPFTTRSYSISSFTDSCYLNTSSIKYFNSNDNSYIRIDSLTSTHIAGSFYGDFIKGTTLYGSGERHTLRKGRFHADGQF